MKLKKHLLFILGLVFLVGMMTSCVDPRKNCNHPDHGKYMQERINKRRGIKF